MEAKIIKIGSSKGIVLNHSLLHEIGAKEGDRFNVSVSDGVISLIKKSSPHDEFEAFFKKNGPMTDSSTLTDTDVPASTLREWTW